MVKKKPATWLNRKLAEPVVRIKDTEISATQNDTTVSISKQMHSDRFHSFAVKLPDQYSYGIQITREAAKLAVQVLTAFLDQEPEIEVKPEPVTIDARSGKIEIAETGRRAEKRAEIKNREFAFNYAEGSEIPQDFIMNYSDGIKAANTFISHFLNVYCGQLRSTYEIVDTVNRKLDVAERTVISGKGADLDSCMRNLLANTDKKYRRKKLAILLVKIQNKNGVFRCRLQFGIQV